MTQDKAVKLAYAVGEANLSPENLTAGMTKFNQTLEAVAICHCHKITRHRH
jgi:hypothetical protein